jgi:cytoskeletal protein RodZ
MAPIRSNKSRIRMIIILCAVVLIGAIATIFIVRQNSTNETTTNKTETAGTAEPAPDDTDATVDAPTDTTSPAESETPTVDPATLSSIDIEPLGITVAYTKGVPGFDFNVKRTASSTQYVEFSSTELAGTKCTDDEGLFASIIKNPSTNEDQTVSQTVTVGSDTYGLSLSAKGCTTNPALLEEYQSAFKNGFPSLKTL